MPKILRSIIYPTGQAVDYIADTTDPGRIAQVRIDSSQTLADGIAYKPFGPLKAMTLGNAIQFNETYDKNYQISAITAGWIIDRTYTPDNTGNIAAITDNLDASRSQSFGYDDLNRLTSASGIYGTIGFTYDRTGNRMTLTSGQGTDTYSYISGTNRLDTITGAQTIKFDHDSRGNMTGCTFVTGAAPTGTDMPDYTYTHDGQRVSKTLSDGTTVYHYDFTGQLIAETDATGNMLKAYIWLNGRPLAMIAADGSVYYYHNDHLGTPQKMTDSSAAVVWAADYLPFGQADVTLASVENNLRFAGQYYDAETGLHYNYWRFYDPSLGRYLRADPIGLAGGVNLYTYVQNNPVNFIDPLGLYVWGINVGGSFTHSGMKAGASTALLFDHKGNFAIVTTQEAGAGVGKAAGLFNNAVWGGKGTTVNDYAGRSVSASGSIGKMTAAVSVPVYGDDGSAKFFYELGFSPLSKGTAEAGATISFGQIAYQTDIFGETGRWWGNFFYDLLHPKKNEKQCN